MLLAGQKVYVGPFLKKSDRPMDKESRFTNVYVKNLPDSVDDQKLNQMFSEHGSVTSAIVMKVLSASLPLFKAQTACHQQNHRTSSFTYSLYIASAMAASVLGL